MLFIATPRAALLASTTAGMMVAWSEVLHVVAKEGTRPVARVVQRRSAPAVAAAAAAAAGSLAAVDVCISRDGLLSVPILPFPPLT
jgi:hypothetical protein